MSTKHGSSNARPLTDDLHWLLVRLARGLGIAEDAAVRRRGLSLRGYVVLCEIATASTSRSQLALASSAVIDKSVLVGLLDELEEAGFVTRTPDPEDRRSKLLAITAPGRKALMAAQADVRTVENKLLAGVTADQRHTLIEVLRVAVQSGLAASFDTKPAV